MQEPRTKRHKLEIRRAQLELERSSFIGHWKSIANVTMPSRARFQLTDGNRGDRRNHQIIDSTATTALRTARSGMTSGITSPARPWFRYSTPDPDLAEFEPVKDWLHTVSTRIGGFLLRSNYYNVKPIVYGDLINFGTAPYSIEEDFDNVIHCTSFSVGSYMIAKDWRGRVNTFIRDLRMTVEQVVEKFGRIYPNSGRIDWSNMSSYVKQQYEVGNYASWVDICHAIHPNENYDPKKARVSAKYKKFASCYYERGNGSTSPQNMVTAEIESKFLRESGYDYFPVMCPRWEVTDDDVYGTSCPGMIALGDINQLQWGEKKIAKAIEKMIDPPLQAPTQLQRKKTSSLPGDVTYVDVRDGIQGLRPIHEVQFRIDLAEQKQEQIRNRIRKAYYEDLFLMLANDERSNVTAREIVERKEEKMIALGPVLEQLNVDDLDPSHDIFFEIGMRQGLFPPPPKELEGQDLKVEYVSVMAQAQKLVAIGGIERFSGFVGNIAKYDPRVLKKIDAMQMVDDYGEAIGISPKIIRSDDEVAEIEAADMQAQKAAQAQQSMAGAAQMAKTLSETKLDNDNALGRIIGQTSAPV